MVAFALSAFALAVGAGCAGPTELASPFSVARADTNAGATSVNAARPKGEALAMALATDNAAEGPTPALALQMPSTDYALRGFMPVSATADSPLFGYEVGLADSRSSFGPSSGSNAAPGAGEWRPLELSIAAGAPEGIDFYMSRRAGAAQGPNGFAQTAGAEVRIGQRLSALTSRFQSPSSWRRPAWYVFAASDGEALIYTPTSDPMSPNRNFTTQDRVTVGSMQAGLSMEAHGMQASLSYVQRKVTTMDLIRHEESRDEDFTGLTFTWRR